MKRSILRLYLFLLPTVQLIDNAGLPTNHLPPTTRNLAQAELFWPKSCFIFYIRWALAFNIYIILAPSLHRNKSIIIITSISVELQLQLTHPTTSLVQSKLTKTSLGQIKNCVADRSNSLTINVLYSIEFQSWH